jgi:hypothetical protein
VRRLLHLLLSQPDLVAEHAHAYAELAIADAQAVSKTTQSAALWAAALLCCVIVTAVLTGVAVMIWATLPEGTIRAPWALLATPLVPLVGALACFRGLKANGETPAFATVRRQIAADMRMLQEVGVP